MNNLSKQQGFTLIELSIVLIIIGLIVGGIFVGQDLIRASEERATITQIEKYNQAVATFKAKYNALPGDMDGATASTYGFVVRGPYAGEGDGNGVLEGASEDAPGHNYGYEGLAGETVMFWVDLSQAQLIDGTFNSASPRIMPTNYPVTGTNIDLYLPEAKIGKGNYVYVYSGTYAQTGSWTQNDINYYGISALTGIGVGACTGCIDSGSSMSVRQAYDIDAKIDDGMPQTGRVAALYLNHSVVWGGTGNVDVAGPYTTPVSGSITSCFDNGGTNGAPQQYSLDYKNGSEPNCSLSFQFQ